MLVSIARRVREYADVWPYMLRHDRTFQLSAALAAAGLALTALGAIGGEIGLVFYLSLAVAVAGVAWSFMEIHRHGPRHRGKEFYLEPATGFLEAPAAAEAIPFSHLQPSPTDARAGYTTVATGLPCRGHAIASDAANAALTARDSLPAVRAERNIGGEISADQSLLHDRLRFLHAAVFGPKLTTNERKLGLCSDIAPEIEDATVRPVGYYDSLVTNEAARNRVRIRPRGGTYPETETHDLRHTFPARRHDGRWVLLPLSECRHMANHVGVTTVALSREGVPILAQQHGDMLIGAGRLTSAGSGSMDFADLRASGGDLLAAVRLGMARELVEEAYDDLGGTAADREARKIASRTHVTGFFRWVERAGKPEFVGVTRATRPLRDLRFRRLELVQLPRTPIDAVAVASVGGFAWLHDELARLTRAGSDGSGFSVGLSTAVALWRLAQIARGETQADRRLRTALATTLDLPEDGSAPPGTDISMKQQHGQTL